MTLVLDLHLKQNEQKNLRQKNHPSWNIEALTNLVWFGEPSSSSHSSEFFLQSHTVDLKLGLVFEGVEVNGDSQAEFDGVSVAVGDVGGVVGILGEGEERPVTNYDLTKLVQL